MAGSDKFDISIAHGEFGTRVEAMHAFMYVLLDFREARVHLFARPVRLFPTRPHHVHSLIVLEGVCQTKQTGIYQFHPFFKEPKNNTNNINTHPLTRVGLFLYAPYLLLVISSFDRQSVGLCERDAHLCRTATATYSS
jgi:hypothetical protein